MKTGSRVLLIFLILSAGNFLGGRAHGQSAKTSKSVNPDLTCSPAPCVLAPTQASEGGSIVTDSPIVTNPVNQKDLLLGSFDGNCAEYGSSVGFHLSRDGGSTWNRTCMPGVVNKSPVPTNPSFIVFFRSYSVGAFCCFEQQIIPKPSPGEIPRPAGKNAGLRNAQFDFVMTRFNLTGAKAGHRLGRLRA